MSFAAQGPNTSGKDLVVHNYPSAKAENYQFESLEITKNSLRVLRVTAAVPLCCDPCELISPISNTTAQKTSSNLFIMVSQACVKGFNGEVSTPAWTVAPLEILMY